MPLPTFSKRRKGIFIGQRIEYRFKKVLKELATIRFLTWVKCRRIKQNVRKRYQIP